jgi:hypothetical protein
MEERQMQCPGCKSDHTQRLEVVYEGGTQDVSATSYTAEAGLMGASLAKFGMGGAVTATSGQTQSKLAQRLAPPAKKTIPMWAWVSLLIPAFGIIIFLVVWNNGRKWNKAQWPALYDEWLTSWYCNKCGTVFKPA